jgi:hypothetical protein
VSERFQIPAGALITETGAEVSFCAECGRECNLRDDQVRRRITGYVRPRKRGVHAVELMQYDGTVLCQWCTRDRKNGHVDQMRLA